MDRNDSTKRDERDEEREDLEQLRRDIGENYDAGFGKLLEDSAAAEVDQAIEEHH